MRNVEPTAQLPVMEHPCLTNALPRRSAKHNKGIRNLTGLYLGVDGQKEDRKGPVVPPLSKGRGMPSHRIRTPTEERRYNKVELLRVKENKTGFSGQPLKKRDGSPEPVLERAKTAGDKSRQSTPAQESPDFWDITRQTKRNFTAATNAGVTHLEYLAPDPHGQILNFYPGAFNTSMVDTVTNQLHETAVSDKQQEQELALIECYRKVCKGNKDALQTLLPHRQLNSSGQNYKYTGFLVKSYRNPNQAEIIADFPQQPPRPRTVLGSYSRPYVPSPYFFKSYNSPKTAGDQYRNMIVSSPYSDSSFKIGVFPGAGQISRSVSRGKQNPSPRLNTPLGFDIPLHRNAPGPVTSREPSANRIKLQEKIINKISQAHVDINVPVVDNKSESVVTTTISKLETDINAPPNTINTEDTSVKQENVNETGNTEAAIKGNVDDEKVSSNDQQEVEEDENLNSNNNNNIDFEDILEDFSEATPMRLEQELKTDDNCKKTTTMTTLATTTMPTPGAGGRILKKMPSGADIMLGLEDELGEQKPIEIDETDDALDENIRDIPAPRRKVSITERVLRNKNSELQLAQIQAQAEWRKRQLADLLLEHAQLVHQVELMEGETSPGADKENNKFMTPPSGGSSLEQ